MTRLYIFQFPKLWTMINEYLTIQQTGGKMSHLSLAISPVLSIRSIIKLSTTTIQLFLYSPLSADSLDDAQVMPVDFIWKFLDIKWSFTDVFGLPVKFQVIAQSFPHQCHSIRLRLIQLKALCSRLITYGGNNELCVTARTLM